jgi:hypothetical protein
VKDSSRFNLSLNKDHCVNVKMTSSLENLSNNFGGKLPILDSSNWDRRNKQVKVIFGFQEVQDVVETGVEALPANATEEQRTAHKSYEEERFQSHVLHPSM